MKYRAHLLAIVSIVLLMGADAPEWTTDLDKMKIPDAAVSGKVHGKEFKIDGVRYDPVVSTLSFYQGKMFFPELEMLIFLFLKKEDKLEGTKIEVPANEESVAGRPHVYVKWLPQGEKLLKTESFTSKYAMKLEFGEKKDGKIPCKIYLCTPDNEKSVIAGKFEIEVK